MGAIAFTGAWALQGINVARNPQVQGSANADTGTIGLSGDAGATSQLPAGWVANMTGGVTIAGTAGGDQTLVGATAAAIAAFLQTRVRVSYVFVTTPDIGAPTGNVAYFSTKNGASPWRVTLTLSGTPDTAPCDAEFYVEYFWSAAAGR